MTLHIPDHIVWQDVPGELALFDARSESYHALNGSAAEIWRALSTGLDPDAVAQKLAETYEAPRAEVAQDVAAFVADALAKGLLEAG